MKNFEN